MSPASAAATVNNVPADATASSARLRAKLRLVLGSLVWSALEWRDIAPSAQTERRGDAGPVGGLLGGKDPTGRFVLCYFARWSNSSRSLPKSSRSRSGANFGLFF